MDRLPAVLKPHPSAVAEQDPPELVELAFQSPVRTPLSTTVQRAAGR
jgi:hypothetical protein